MSCVSGHGSSNNHVDNDHEFCFSNTILRDFRDEGKFRTCTGCGLLLAVCALHNRGRNKHVACHATQVAYFAASCKYNGSPSAVAGFGIVMGEKDNQVWAIPVTHRVDKQDRTNNRTDLLAAMECIRKMVFAYTHPYRSCEARPSTWIVASCSDYVVKNYSRHFDNWRARGWKKSNGEPLANADLWFRLDNMVEKYQDKYGIKIGFYRAYAEGISDSAITLARGAVDALDR